MLDFRFELPEPSTVFGNIFARLLNEFGVVLAIVFDVVTEFCDHLFCRLLANLEQKIFIFQFFDACDELLLMLPCCVFLTLCIGCTAFHIISAVRHGRTWSDSLLGSRTCWLRDGGTLLRRMSLLQFSQVSDQLLCTRLRDVVAHFIGIFKTIEFVRFTVAFDGSLLPWQPRFLEELHHLTRRHRMVVAACRRQCRT